MLTEKVFANLIEHARQRVNNFSPRRVSVVSRLSTQEEAFSGSSAEAIASGSCVQRRFRRRCTRDDLAKRRATRDLSMEKGGEEGDRGLCPSRNRSRKERKQEDARVSRYDRPRFTHIKNQPPLAQLSCRTCAHACAVYRRPRIRDNVIDDDIERRSSRSRAFQRSERPSGPLSPRCGRETSFPINSCTDANGRLSPLDINDG